MTDYMDQGVKPPVPASTYKDEMLADMTGDDWEFAVNVSNQAMLIKPGWEITRQWSSMYQAIAISSKYRFVGQGSTPSTALADAYQHMRDFYMELKRHMEAT
uniref:Uncharacterized protein n=1 Tax=Dinoroseobacter phage vB_DshS_R26L TaxID=3161158 RepID=A0AAU7VFW7_9CAUD